MEQKSPAENSSQAPGQVQRHKYGGKVSPVSGDVNKAYDVTDSKSVKSVNYDAGGDITHTYDVTSKVASPSKRGSRHHLLPDLLPDVLKIPHLRVLNGSRPRDEEITKCQTKCFFFILGIALMAFGIGLIVYGVDADLRDFLILGPSFLIIGFILIVIGSVLICKDVYILNQSGPSKHLNTDDEEDYYNIQPLDAEEVVQANSRRMDLYTVTSSRPQTVTSQRSDGVLTTSELLMEQRPELERQETPEPMVPTRRSHEKPTRPVPHQNSAPNSPAKAGLNSAIHGGSTITVKSSEEGDTYDNTVQNSDGNETVQNTDDSTDKIKTTSGHISSNKGSSEDNPANKAEYCSPVHSAHPIQNEVITTEL